tara:strand:- start:3863 stop:4030 length:168 start_codon:yes stop_codon:yes gene_type:complete
MKVIKFDSVSEVNILIEIINHYIHCYKKNNIISLENIEKLLDVLLQTQKMFIKGK